MQHKKFDAKTWVFKNNLEGGLKVTGGAQTYELRGYLPVSGTVSVSVSDFEFDELNIVSCHTGTDMYCFLLISDR